MIYYWKAMVIYQQIWSFWAIYSFRTLIYGTLETMVLWKNCGTMVKIMIYLFTVEKTMELWQKLKYCCKLLLTIVFYFNGYLLAEVVKFLSQRIFSAKLVEINLLFIEKISVYFYLFVYITHPIGNFYQTFAKFC